MVKGAQLVIDQWICAVVITVASSSLFLYFLFPFNTHILRFIFSFICRALQLYDTVEEGPLLHKLGGRKSINKTDVRNRCHIEP